MVIPIIDRHSQYDLWPEPSDLYTIGQRMEDTPFTPNDMEQRILGGRRPVGYRITFRRINRTNDPQRMMDVLTILNDRSFSIARKVIRTSTNIFSYVMVVEIQFVSKVHHARFDALMGEIGATLFTIYP